MDIIVLCHGLGNQFSQYALFLNKRNMGQRVYAFYAFKEHNGYELARLCRLNEGLPAHLFFIKYVLRFALSRRLFSNKVRENILALFRIKVVLENDSYAFDQKILQPWFGIRILFGGWHDERYFAASSDLICSKFSLPEPDGALNLAVLRSVSDSDSISIHVRRGDYMKSQNHIRFGNIATASYYQNALEWALKNSKVAKVFVFSDDFEWCKKNLTAPDITFVNWNTGADSWKDLALMSKCRINIIANSTFSWWGAWLNGVESKIALCPTQFVNSDNNHSNVYPKGWHRIEAYDHPSFSQHLR